MSDELEVVTCPLLTPPPDSWTQILDNTETTTQALQAVNTETTTQAALTSETHKEDLHEDNAVHTDSIPPLLLHTPPQLSAEEATHGGPTAEDSGAPPPAPHISSQLTAPNNPYGIGYAQHRLKHPTVPDQPTLAQNTAAHTTHRRPTTSIPTNRTDTEITLMLEQTRIKEQELKSREKCLAMLQKELNRREKDLNERETRLDAMNTNLARLERRISELNEDNKLLNARLASYTNIGEEPQNSLPTNPRGNPNTHDRNHNTGGYRQDQQSRPCSHSLPPRHVCCQEPPPQHGCCGSNHHRQRCCIEVCFPCHTDHTTYHGRQLGHPLGHWNTSYEMPMPTMQGYYMPWPHHPYMAPRTPPPYPYPLNHMYMQPGIPRVIETPRTQHHGRHQQQRPDSQATVGSTMNHMQATVPGNRPEYHINPERQQQTTNVNHQTPQLQRESGNAQPPHESEATTRRNPIPQGNTTHCRINSPLNPNTLRQPYDNPSIPTDSCPKTYTEQSPGTSPHRMDGTTNPRR